jgi:hypothetical protein
MTRKRKLILFLGVALLLVGCLELRDAVDALARFSPNIALPVLLPMLDDPNPPLREYVTNVLARIESGASDPSTTLGIVDGCFTVNNRSAFLLGYSYFAALGASDNVIRNDLNAFQRRRFNWLRVFATWNAFGTNLSIAELSGQAREPFLGKLKWLVQECDHRGIIVDVTLARGKDALPDFNSHKAAVTTLVTELHSYRNWYLDLANEHDVRDNRFVSGEELKLLRDEVRRLDASRLVTASFGGHDLNADEIRAAVQTVGLDFICPHRPRTPESPGQTFRKTTNYLAMLKHIGKVVPLHYQEPCRRDYADWQPKADDFLTDLRGAIQGGAAGWCFHNGSTRDTSKGGPRRCFDLRSKRLFDQLDPEERKVVDDAADVLAQAPRPTSSSR